MLCTMSSSRRLSDRSATSPPHGPRSRTGPNCAAARAPSAMPLSVSLRTSSVCATSVSQLPICEISWPVKNSRKLRTRSDRKVASKVRRIAVTPSRHSRVLGQLGERHGAIVVRLLRESEYALADDVALDLIGTAVDGRGLREQRHACDHREEWVARRLVERFLVVALVRVQHSGGADDAQPEI